MDYYDIMVVVNNICEEINFIEIDIIFFLYVFCRYFQQLLREAEITVVVVESVEFREDGLKRQIFVRFVDEVEGQVILLFLFYVFLCGLDFRIVYKDNEMVLIKYCR